MRELNDHPDTVFTVLTGEGRFFSAGADIMSRQPLPTFRSAKLLTFIADTPIVSLGEGDTEAEVKLAVARALLQGTFTGHRI